MLASKMWFHKYFLMRARARPCACVCVRATRSIGGDKPPSSHEKKPANCPYPIRGDALQGERSNASIQAHQRERSEAHNAITGG